MLQSNYKNISLILDSSVVRVTASYSDKQGLTPDKVTPFFVKIFPVPSMKPFSKV